MAAISAVVEGPDMPLRILPILLGLAATSVALAAPGYHLWYDENGQAVYSQFAPGEGRDSTLVKPPPPPAEAPEVARQRLNDRLQHFEDVREDKTLAGDKATQAAVVEDSRQRRCADARKNLELLNGPPRQLFKTEDGVRRMTDEERRKQRADMEKIVAESCR